jgi:two-component system response regulator YesN
VAREGIRDNVDWKVNGFEFCGEAPDGEIALPLLQASQPDFLITDINAEAARSIASSGFLSC